MDDLHDAVLAGDTTKVRILLSQGADPEARNKHGITALGLAMAHQKLRVIPLLLDAGADLFARNPDQQTPLQYSRRLLNPKLEARTRELAEKQAEGRHDVSLELAAECGLTGKVASLLASGVPSSDAAFVAASRAGNVDVLALLLDAGAHLDVWSNDWSPIHLAAASGNGAAVELLIGAGADPNIPTRGRNPLFPLHIAVIMDKPDCVTALLKGGADPKQTVLVSRPGSTKAKTAADLAHTKKVRALFAGGEPQPEDEAYRELDRRKERASTPEWEAVLARAEELIGRKPSPWKRRKGVSVVYGKESSKIEALREEMRASGYQLISGSELESGATPFLLFPVTNGYSVLAACGTNAANYGLGTRELIRELMSVTRGFPFVVESCGFDFVGGRFDPPVPEPEASALSQQFARLCPDIGGETDVREFAREIHTTGRFFLWWD
jgi:ankyrin repeat protein